MAQLSWGKPTIEIGKCGVEGATAAVWTKLSFDPVENSTKLTPTKSEKKETKVEGGENEDAKYAKNAYIFLLTRLQYLLMKPLIPPKAKGGNSKVERWVSELYLLCVSFVNNF